MTLETSKLLPLAQLMAFAAQADGRVTPDELAALQEYLSGRLQGSARGEFFTLFRTAIEQRPDLERLVSDIHGNLPDRHSRIEAYAGVRTLLLEGGLTAEESIGLPRVASLLGIPPEDADLLANGTAAQVAFRYPINRDRMIRLEAGERALQVTALDLNGLFAISSATTEIFVNGVGHRVNEIVFLRSSDHVSVAQLSIGFADIARLFVLIRNNVTCDCRLVVEKDRLVSIGETAPPTFAFRVNEAQLSFTRLDPQASVTLNGEPLEGGTQVVPSDVLAFDAGQLRVSQILDSLDQASWALGEKPDATFRYVIATRQTAATSALLPDLDEELEIVLEESGSVSAPLRLTCVESTGAGGFLDGEPVTRGFEKLLSAPATLRVAHHWFAIDPDVPNIDYSKRIIEDFEVRGVTYRFKHGTGLRDVSFRAGAGQLVGIMGASGAGKSTLLSVLLDTLQPTEGSVHLNGLPLSAQLRRNRSILGYVPQDDLVMDNLTVEENLRYTGRLRLPHLSSEELTARVSRVLRDTGLHERRHLRVGSPVRKVLSGGQRKRLNIGIELLADPELFFLDEPTSGLSSQDSKMIMALLGQLARRGKLVFTVIHQPSSEIFKMLDQLLLLDTGGVLVWCGAGRDAVHHFRSFLPNHREFVECPACGSINPETMLHAIEQPLPVQAGSIEARPRRFDPEFWRNAFLLRAGRNADARVPAPQPLHKLPPVGALARLRVMGASIGRAFTDRVRDRTNIIMSVAAPVMLALVMGGMLRGPDIPYTYAGNSALPRFLFLSTIVFVFFGLMASVNEVVRELALIRRERVSGFRAGRYVASKALAFLPFSLVQAGLYCAVASLVLQFPYRAPDYSPLQPALPFAWYVALVGLAVIQAAFALGLLISTFLRSQAAAFNWIPLVVIPQILLGGVFVDYADMPKLTNRPVPEYAELTFTRWAYEALLAGERTLNPPHTLNADELMRSGAGRASPRSRCRRRASRPACCTIAS
jgi:ABC-type multidrug transport system ATPase subunit